MVSQILLFALLTVVNSQFVDPDGKKLSTETCSKPVGVPVVSEEDYNIYMCLGEMFGMGPMFVYGCHNSWSTNEAKVICRMLNRCKDNDCSNADLERKQPDDPNVMIMEVQYGNCNGDENNITDCQHLHSEGCNSMSTFHIKCKKQKRKRKRTRGRRRRY